MLLRQTILLRYGNGTVKAKLPHYDRRSTVKKFAKMLRNYVTVWKIDGNYGNYGKNHVFRTVITVITVKITFFCHFSAIFCQFFANFLQIFAIFFCNRLTVIFDGTVRYGRKMPLPYRTVTTVYRNNPTCL